MHCAIQLFFQVAGNATFEVTDIVVTPKNNTFLVSSTTQFKIMLARL